MNSRIAFCLVLAAACRDTAPAPTPEAIARDNGFVILGKTTTDSFHAGYREVFKNHQPVYVTADSVLHAWHASYEAILIELETTSLVPALQAMLEGLRTGLGQASGDDRARADVDAYLAVGLSLLNGRAEPPVAGGDAAVIAGTLAQQAAAASGIELELFGTKRLFDFSMLMPRGHYTRTPQLEQYFRAISWLGRVEIRIARKAETDAPWQVDRRALRAAMLLSSLFTPEVRARWSALDGTLAALIGPSDSMSLSGLAAGLAALPDAGSASDAQIVAAFHDRAAQRINTQMIDEGDGEQTISFLVLGQRFVVDADILGAVAYGKITAERMMPSTLDVGYAVLGNPAARLLLARELASYGPSYPAALEAAARRIEADPALWTGSVYHAWLGALRGLSPSPQRDASLPAPLASDAWARRLLATQLASWAELRHDNVLYAKESGTFRATCEYPDGYVDPYPAFFAGMEALAIKGRDAIACAGPGSGATARMVEFFERMASTMARLGAIAERERANEPLTADDLEFLNHMVAMESKARGCTIELVPSGWYADLYYAPEGVLVHQPVVADVHTQSTDRDGDLVGKVLHVGTGLPRMLVVTVAHDHGAHAQTYRGFVSSYGETVTENFRRLTDEDWTRRVFTNQVVLTPAWLRSLVAY